MNEWMNEWLVERLNNGVSASIRPKFNATRKWQDWRVIFWVHLLKGRCCNSPNLLPSAYGCNYIFTFSHNYKLCLPYQHHLQQQWSQRPQLQLRLFVLRLTILQSLQMIHSPYQFDHPHASQWYHPQSNPGDKCSVRPLSITLAFVQNAWMNGKIGCYHLQCNVECQIVCRVMKCDSPRMIYIISKVMFVFHSFKINNILLHWLKIFF